MKKLCSAVMAILFLLATCCSCSAETGSSAHVGSKAKDSYLNGTKLSEFSIVYSEEDFDYSKRAAEYIQSEILARTGLQLALIEDHDEASTEYEIVVGETARDISSRLNADIIGTQFAIFADDKQVAIEGNYFTIAAAAYYFIDTYVPEDNFGAVIPKEISIHEPIVKPAKNYMLLIGDGMGLYQTLLFDFLDDTSNYSDKEDCFYGYYLPYFGFARTNSLSGVTDSAASGTALSSGRKTVNEYIGQDADRNEVQSLTELASSLGLGTAVMSTESSTGATPAAFSAHTDTRYNTMDILADQQLLKKTYGTIIQCGEYNYSAGMVDRLEGKITETLNALSTNENGFFLMFEEANIDKHCHNYNDLDNAFLAILRFNQAIARFMEYAFYHPDTFVLITADHETGNLLPTAEGVLSESSGRHSPQYVPVFAYGSGGELFDRTVVENIQIPQTIASFMGVTDFGDQSTHQYLS